VRASVPHDVDLEDHLVYGLTPVRFGYLVVAVLGVMSVWGLHALPVAVRLLACALLVAAAVILAWGRWRGRPVDRLVADVTVFVRRNYRPRVGFGPRPRAWTRRSAEPALGVATVSLTAINTLGRRGSRAVPGEGE
jgi:hypothetical protein